MNLKTRLFGKPWQQKDPEIRARAVSESEDQELIDELPRLSHEDESVAVRLAALKRINTESTWLEARARESDAEILVAADRQILREMLRSDNAETRDGRLRWLKGIKSSDTIRQLARTAPDVAIRKAALARVSAQGFLGDCYSDEQDEALAGEILERIEQVSTLERMQERLRKTSKQRAQAVARRLANLNAASGQADPDHKVAEVLVNKIEALSRGGGKGDRASELATLKSQWDEIRQPDPGLQRRFEGAEAIVQSALNRPAAAPSEPEEAVEPPAQELSADPELVQMAASIRDSLRHARKGFDPGEWLSAWDRSWNRIKAPNEADQALKTEMLPILRELQSQVEFRARKRKESEARSASPDEASDSFNPRIDELAELLDSGDVAAAHALLGELKKEFSKLSGRARPQAVAGRFQRMEGRLKEKRDWQHWSNNQHRDELIEQVSSLAGSGQHPDAISATLKQAREEWQRLEKLEVLPGDRKRFAAPPGQWRRFQAACQEAFDQAKPFFEKRNEVQEDALDKLEQFVEQGLAQARDESVDSKVLLNTQRAARQAIRRLDELPPRTRGKSAARLRELMDKISARLDHIFDEIEQAKRQLITEANALADEPNLKLAIDKAKALQAQWQQSGSGRRKIEQKLWKEFREPIEPLFAQLKGERQEQKQAEKAALDELKALCKQAEALTQVDDAELGAARDSMAELVKQWEGQGRAPGPLHQRFTKARADFRQRMDQLAQQTVELARVRIDDLADAVQQVWEARLAGKDGLEAMVPEARDDDEPAAAELQALAATLAQADAPADTMADQVNANGDQARQIVVEMEFLSGLDSPESDQALRMDYQVKRLARRMSEGNQLPPLDQELTQLQKRWLKALPQPVERHEELKRRFRRARDILLNMSGL